MNPHTDSLMSVYEGWDGYQHSLVQALLPLTAEHLRWRPAPQLRTVGETFRHIALGRISWFLRMNAPGSRELAGRISHWGEDPHGNRYIREDAIEITEQTDQLTAWLQDSWQMVDQTLKTWTVEDLKTTYRHTYHGNTYAVSRQWTIWRIMAHDIHHGGQLVVSLEMQGVQSVELGALGGHITEPPLADLSAL